MKSYWQYAVAGIVLMLGLTVWIGLAVLYVVSWFCGESIGFILRAIWGIIEDDGF